MKINNFAMRDYKALLALSAARKAVDAQVRVRMQSNAELCSELLAQAVRRGGSEIDWASYFRDVGV